MPGFTERFDRALVLAHKMHRDQLRKGSEVPYIGHLLGVAAIVIDDDGSEDEAIAALLHDAAEDQGGAKALGVIEKEFGTHVRDLVEDLSDTLEDPKPPWRERKEAYLAHLRTVSPEARRVSLADKLYNAHSIVRDHRRVGDEVWDRFNATKEQTVWYYRELAKVFKEEAGGALADELDDVVEDLAAL